MPPPEASSLLQKRYTLSGVSIRDCVCGECVSLGNAVAWFPEECDRQFCQDRNSDGLQELGRSRAYNNWGNYLILTGACQNFRLICTYISTASSHNRRKRLRTNQLSPRLVAKCSPTPKANTPLLYVEISIDARTSLGHTNHFKNLPWDWYLVVGSLGIHIEISPILFPPISYLKLRNGA